MSVADAVAGVMFSAIILYAVFGGADFGSGVWDLTAGPDERGAPLRRLVDRSIGPVWEANHVWLIFVLVFLWTGFPQPFAALARTLAVPLWLAALGIVGRGAGFAFRKFAPTLRWARMAGITFAAASLLTPFFLGTIAGAVASGRVQLSSPPDRPLFSPWLGPTSLVGGVLAVGTCTFLAGVLLGAEAESRGQHHLVAILRRRTLIVGGVTGAVVIAGIGVLATDAPVLVEGLLGRALPLVVVSAVAGLGAMVQLWYDHIAGARVSAAVAVGAVVAGWGIAQYPWLLVDEVTIDDGAGASTTLVGLLIAAGVAAVVVVPPLLYLYSLANSNVIEG